MSIVFAILFLLALGAAFALLRLAHIQQRQTGLPVGARIIYADTGAWKKVEEPLFSRRYGLAGKPDYILEENGAAIPVEVKPNRATPAPRRSDVMQLAAYGLLIEEAFETIPSHGLLKYRDTVFQIDLTPDLRAELITLLGTIRRQLAARDVPRDHAEPHRCRACGYRIECGQALE